MDKDPMIELSELNDNLFSPVSNSKENLIEVSFMFVYNTL